MISALVNSFKGILRHPACLIPALISGAVMVIVFLAVFEQFFDFIINAAFLGEIPNAGMEAMPFQLFFLYSGNLTALFLAFVVSLIAMVSANFFYANYAKELLEKKPSMGKAFSKTIGQLSSVVAIVIFFLIIGAFAIILFWIFALLGTINIIVSILLILLLILLIFYIAVKLAFLIPIMAIESEKAKKAIEKSWDFTAKKFWTTFLFLIIVMAVSAIILNIGSAVSDAILEPEISFIIFAVFWAFSTAYSGLAIAFYYLEKS